MSSYPLRSSHRYLQLHHYIYNVIVQMVCRLKPCLREILALILVIPRVLNWCDPDERSKKANVRGPS